MQNRRLRIVGKAPTDEIVDLVPSWTIHLEGEGKSESTIRNYLQAVRHLAEFLAEKQLPTCPERVTKEHIDRFRIHVRDRARERGKSDGSSTSNTRRAALLQFFRWCHEVEGICDANPVTLTKPMKEPDRQIPVVTQDELRALLKACSGQDFYERRDMAVISCYVDTGARLSELLVDLQDVDLANWCIRVLGKGRKERLVPIAAKARSALDRYLRVRARHAFAHSTRLWLGTRGPLTKDGISSMVDRRCRQAGIDPINVHRFRHTFCHEWLMASGNEHELAQNTGWGSTQMVARYARSAASDRARAAHRRLSLLDRL